MVRLALALLALAQHGAAQSLWIFGEQGAAVVLRDASIRVANRGASQALLLQNLEVRGFLVDPFFGAGDPALEIESSAGSVKVEGCAFLPSELLSLQTGLAGGGGARVTNSSAVSFARCTFVGGVASSFPAPGSLPGLEVATATVALYDCTLDGGFAPGNTCAAFGTCGAALPAGSGVLLRDGAWAFASGCAFAGGDGGDGLPCSLPPYPGGDAADGGHGAHVAAISAALLALDCTFQAGTAGVALCTSGVPGQTIRNDGGTSQTLAGKARSIRVTSPVVGGVPVTVTLEGPPGELVFGLVSLSPGFAFLAPLDGVLLTASAFSFFFLGAMPPGGALVFQVATAPPPGGAGWHVRHLQFATVTAALEVELGPGATLATTQ